MRGRVCIVENEAARVEELRELLSNGGYTGKHVRDSSNVLADIVSAEPDLVLLSTHLGETRPEGILDQLKGDERTRDLPVVFITRYEDLETRGKAISTGDDLILEPFNEHEVIARIERQVTVSKVRMALRESEAKFQSVMESAIDAIISADARGRILSWNRAAAAMFGHTEEEVVGKPIEIIIPERFRARHAEGIRRVSSGGESHVIGKTVELAAINRDKVEFPVELSLATWFLEEKRYYTGIIRNIEERKQAEQKFRSVTESAVDAIISANNRGEIISWNQAASRILGYTEAEAVGCRLELIIPERFHHDHRQGMRRFNRTGEAHAIGKTVELAARTKQGTEVPIELSLSTWVVRNERYYTGIIRDIGERKRAEEALRKSEEALRQKTVEMQRKNHELEATLKQLNEMHSQLIIQEKMASLGKLSAGMAHELNNPAAAAQRSAVHLQDMFGKLQAVQEKMATLSFAESHIGKMVELDERAKERVREPVKLSALLRSEREERLEQLLGDSTGNGSDIVSALVGAGFDEEELCELKGTFDEQQFPVVVEWLGVKSAIYSLAGEIGLATGRIVTLVKALKTYTYMDQAPVQSVDIRKEIDNTLIILNNKLKRGVEVIRRYDDSLPVIEAYASELNQVWTNLIDNAIDAMGGRGTLIIRVRLESPWIVVEIEDDGPGIEPDHLSKIFDPFFTTKPPGKGTGLGLNLSRNLVVDKHRGRMDVQSAPGATCFSIHLPIDFSAVEQSERQGG